MAEKLVGTNYVTPDIVAKVTGRARYAEDFRAEGMLFCKLLLSPQPHARVTRLDTRAALAMPGVRAILTADDLPDLGGAERALTNEPLYGGEPILAVAAVDEATAAEAIERIDHRTRAAALRHRSAGQPAARAAPTRGSRATSGACRRAAAPGAPPARPAIERLKWTDGRLRRRGRGTVADGQGGRGMVLRRSGRRLSPRPHSCSTRPSSSPPPDTIRWRPAARWRTGRTASCICTARRRASSAPWTAWRGGSASSRRRWC